MTDTVLRGASLLAAGAAGSGVPVAVSVLLASRWSPDRARRRLARTAAGAARWILWGWAANAALLVGLALAGASRADLVQVGVAALAAGGLAASAARCVETPALLRSALRAGLAFMLGGAVPCALAAALAVDPATLALGLAYSAAAAAAFIGAALHPRRRPPYRSAVRTALPVMLAIGLAALFGVAVAPI